MAVNQTSIKKLPLIKEDVGTMRSRIQELESQVNQYKTRLDELRKAKNNLIIKKTTEYVNTVLPGQGSGTGVRNRDDRPIRPSEDEDPMVNSQYTQELENVVENLTGELNESKNLVAALRIENEELSQKNEEYRREIKQWEVMYKEWMTMMEDRVTNINRTHQILQQCIVPGQEPQPQMAGESEDENEPEKNVPPQPEKRK